MDTYDAHKSTTEVRQGSRRTMNLRVLILSLIGIVAVFGILYAISTAIQPGDPASVTDPANPPAAVEAPADTATPAAPAV
jgi:hypothetical protein